MKKFFYCGLLAILLLSLFCCSKSDEEIGQTDENVTVDEALPQFEQEVEQDELFVQYEEQSEPEEPEEPFVRPTEFIADEDAVYELLAKIPSVTRKDVIPEKGDVLIPFPNPGTHIKRGAEPADMTIDDAILAFTCNDASVYESPDDTSVTSEVIPKHTFLAWLYSEDADSSFVPVKLFSGNDVSETKYIKKDDIWSNELDVAILYLYKQYMQLRDGATPEATELYRMYLKETLDDCYYYRNLATNLLRKEKKALDAFVGKNCRSLDKNRNGYLEGSSIQRQIDILKAEFPPENYTYYVGVSDALRTNWTRATEGDYGSSLLWFDLEMQVLPAETVYVSEKKPKGYNQFWYYDAADKAIEQVSCLILHNSQSLYGINDSFVLFEMLDDYRNAGLSESEKKDIIYKLNEYKQDQSAMSDSARCVNLALTKLDEDYTLRNEHIVDVTKLKGSFAVVAGTPLLSQPGTIGDVITTFADETDITPEKVALVEEYDGWEAWFRMYYVYIQHDGTSGWVSANNVTAKTGTGVADLNYGESSSYYGGYIEVQEGYHIGPVDEAAQHVDITETSYSDPFEDDFEQVSYKLTDSPFGTEIKVYADSGLTEQIGSLPDLTVVMTDGRNVRVSWKGFGGDGGSYLLAEYILADGISGWVSATDLYPYW